MLTNMMLYYIFIVDWLIADDLCFKVPGRTGKVRYILKNTIKYLPLFGWHLGDVSYVTVLVT